MKFVSVFAFLAVVGFAFSASAHGVGDSVDTQWFTGSLESPSPAIPQAGIFALEPYLITQANSGAYDNSWAHHSVTNDNNQLQSITLMKYAITNELSVQAVPLVAYTWNDQTTSHGPGFGDLPIEFDYRLNNQNNQTGEPSVTVNLGMNFPTGNYQRLSTPLDGLGSGAYTAKEGVLLQSLFNTWNNHPTRLRLWGSAFEAVANVDVQNVSVYGTGQGFQGHVVPGFSSQVGLGAEYGLDQRWVLAVDLVDNYAASTVLKGAYGGGAAVNTNLPMSMSIGVAPAIEYNWSSSTGLIAGVEFSAAGQNAPSYIAPQIALSMVF